MTLNPHPERDYLPAKQCDCARLEQQKADHLARVTAERDRLREALFRQASTLRVVAAELSSRRCGVREPDARIDEMVNAEIATLQAALEAEKGDNAK